MLKKKGGSDLMDTFDRFIVVFILIMSLIAMIIVETCVLIIKFDRIKAFSNGGSVEYETTTTVELNAEYCDE